MKKRILALLLAAVMAAGLLPGTARAEDVALSPQKLTVDGREADCEKYNIGGRNYFKLRDLAWLLNGTDAQFGVNYDAAAAAVLISRGAPYIAVGTEMAMGQDNSGSARLTSQTILIDGVTRGDFTVYNIGGSNFFQLRELGNALGFEVDYIAATNTATVVSKHKEPVLVSEPMTGSPLKYTVTSSSTYVQDMRDYMGASMTVSTTDPSGAYRIFSFSGTRSNEEDVRQFVETICSGAYNLELVDSCYEVYPTTFTSDGGTFADFAINYTGAGRVSATTEANFSRAKCSISLYYTIDRWNNLKGQFAVPAAMYIVDLGLRRGGDTDSLELAGPSAMAGLYLMPDGSYQTSDGRLSAAPDRATVLRDGQRCSVAASYVQDENDGTRERIWVRNFYRDETIYFNTPTHRLMTGDVFVLRDLRYSTGFTYTSAAQFDHFRYTAPVLGLGHDGDFITPRADSSNEFDELTVRIMYWEPDVVGVYYIYAELSTAPYVIEALCAVNL